MWRNAENTRRGNEPVVAVVGGGISGLAAAHRLVERSREEGRSLRIKLLEAKARLGGSIATERVDGFVIEAGPDSFLSEKPWALALCRRLGLEDRLVGTQEQYRHTYVVHDGKLHLLPDGFLLLAPTRFWPLVTSRLFSWPGKLRMGLDMLIPRRRSAEDESLGAFVRRRLGREALERVAQPLVGGIYTADPDRLSLAATMPRFLEMERKYGSIIRAMLLQRRHRPAADANATSGARWSLFVSFDDGMQTLVDALCARLPDGSVQLNTALRELRRRDEGGWLLNGDLHCDAVILATPGPTTARIIEGVEMPLAGELRGIPYASSVTVTLAFRREEIPHPLNGFGFVVPLVEARGIVACTVSSLKYPGRAPAEFVLLRVFAGGALQQDVFDQDDAALERTVRSELAALLGIHAKPMLFRIHRHTGAMPQYHVGHLQRMERIDECLARLPGLALAGNAYRGVGVPDCVRSGEQAAESVFDTLFTH